MTSFYTRQTLEGRIVIPPQHHRTATPSCSIYVKQPGGEYITCVAFNEDAARLRDADINDYITLEVERVDDSILLVPGFALIEKIISIREAHSHE